MVFTKFFPVISIVFLFSSCSGDRDSGNGVEPVDDRIVEISSSSVVSEAFAILTDSRDGQIYKTVKIGSQIWMAQNLNYENSNSFCCRDDASNCSKYGRLYTWTAAMNACPHGWHLPTRMEWDTLITIVGGLSTAATKLKSNKGWSFGNGTDVYYFAALPGGSRNDDGNCYDSGIDTYFWSSTEFEDVSAYAVFLAYQDDNVYLRWHYKYYGFSVRCLQD